MMRSILLGTLMGLLTLPGLCQSDSLELIKLYNSTAGEAWLDSWDLNAAMSTWTGVSLNDTGRVTAISLNANNMKGALPDLNLPELLILVLSNNFLRDTMPPLRRLRKLTFLDLNNNNIDGTLPDFNLPVLQTLRLSGNKLGGQLQDYQNMPKLRTLILDDNELEGGLPDFSNLRNLFTLRLANNNLDGPIVEFNNLPSLLALDLHGNNFITSVPQFRGSPSLFSLDVSDNQLTGELPFFSRLALLDILNLSKNKFTGTVPNLGALSVLSELDISDNLLEGAVPNLSGNDRIIEFNASGNQFSGEIPSYRNLTELQRLDLSENLFSDTLPDFSHLSNLSELRVDSNLLTHSNFDVTLAPNLEILEVQSNYLTFFDIFQTNGLGLTQFTYAPQLPIILADTIFATVGDNVEIDLVEDQGVGNNTYSWYLNGEFSEARAVNELLLTNVNQLDTGIYYCIVKNNSLPALSLFSEEVRLMIDCPINEIMMIDTICQGDTLFVNKVPYFEAGEYTDTVLVPIPSDCDTVFIIDLIVRPIFDTLLFDTLCESDELMFGGGVIKESGTYVDTLSSVDGCDSVVTLQLVVWPSFRQVQAVTLCAGDTLFVGDRVRTEPGIYDDTLQTIYGCDSLITTDLDVLDAFLSVVDTTLCFRDSLEYRGVIYTESGTYRESFVSANGCDSSYVLNLIVPTTDSFFVRSTICSSDSFFVGDTSYSEAGSYMDSLVNSRGCDSIVFLTLSVVEMFEQDIDMVLCEGDTLFFAGDTITTAGIYIDSLKASGGCDSITKIRLNTVPFIPKTINTVLCFGDSLIVGNNIYKVAGTFRDTTSTGGCDTIIISRIQVADPIRLDGVAVQNAINKDGRITPDISGGRGPYRFQWNTGDTTLVIDSLAAGTYQLTVFDSLNCSADFEFEIEQTVSDRTASRLNLQLHIYPNPIEADQWLNLKAETEEYGIYQLQVRNMLGQIMSSQNLRINDYQVDHRLQVPPGPGFYFIHISNHLGQSLSLRFVVQ